MSLPLGIARILATAAASATVPETAAAAALPAAGPAWPLLLLALVVLAMGAVFAGKSENEVSGEEIRDLRKRKNLTQEQLASLLGVGAATIKRWEADAVKPTENNLALLKRLMATPDHLSPSLSENGFQGSLEDLLRILLADGRAKRILASRVLEVDFSDMNHVATKLHQSLEILETVNSSCRMEPALPFPMTPPEKANARQGDLRGVVDAALVEMFEQEREARGLTESKMLETILWKYFGYPAMSFQLREGVAAPDNSTSVIEAREDHLISQ